MAVKVQSIPIDISAVMKENNNSYGAFSGCKPTQEGWVAMTEKVKNSADVQDMGKWAVEEHNRKTGDNLEFQNVLYGWTQDVPLVGTLYLLVIQAKDAKGHSQICGAVVGKTTFFKILIFFARIVIDKKPLNV